MTELEAYLKGVVFEEAPAEEEPEESPNGGVGEGGEGNPETEGGGEEEQEGCEQGEEEEDEEQEDEELKKIKEKQSQKSIKQLKSVSEQIEPVKIKLDATTNRFRSCSGTLPPILWPSDFKTLKQANAIVKLKPSDFAKLKKAIDNKRTDLIGQFTKEQTKIQTEQPIVLAKIADMWTAYWAAWTAFWNTMVVPNIQWIGIVVAFLLIAVLALALILSSVAAAQQSGGLESLYGADGKDHYGVRLIYKDEEQEKEEIIKNFTSVLGETLENAEATFNLDGSLDITLEIATTDEDVTIPEEGTDEYTVVKNIALAVNNIDGGGASASNTMEEIASGITYFGIAGQEMQADVAEAIYTYINENNAYTYTYTGTSSQPEEDAIETLIAEIITNYIKTTYNTRTEKLFVEDVMFKSSEDHLKVTSARNYIAMIYLNKNVVIVDHVWMRAIQEDLEISMNLSYNGQKIAFNREDENFGKKDDEMGDMGDEFESEETPSDEEVGDSQTYVFATPSGMRWIVDKTPEVDTDKPVKGALSQVGSTLNGQEFLQLVEGSENIYTFNTNYLMITFEANKPFYFSEIEFYREIVRT